MTHTIASSASDKAFLLGGGDMGSMIADFDWETTHIGSIDVWPASMKTTLAVTLRSGMPIVTLWGDQGVMIYNDAYRDFAGDRHPALLGKSVLEGWPEIADFNIRVLQQVYHEGRSLSYRDQEQVLFREGTLRPLWIDLEYSPALDEQGRSIGVVGIVRETTNNILASRQLTDDRDRLWAITRDLLLVCSFDGVITAVNPTAKRSLGWDADEMLGKGLSAFIHPDDIQATQVEVERLSRGLSSRFFENRYRTKGGGYRLLSWTAVPDAGRIHAVGRDITEERRLSEDHERAWNLSPVIKIVTDRHGIVTDVNPGWVDALGWTRAETVGGRITQFVVADDAQWHDRLKILSEESRTLIYNSTVRAADGTHRLVEWTTVPDEEFFYGFGRDITTEVESAEALAETEAALRQAQKMEAVGQLTGGIAHDFNNLLQGIMGSLEIMKRRVAKGRVDDLDRFLSGAFTAAERAAALTHRLLAFARRQPLAPKAVDANVLVASMEDLLSRTMGEGVAVKMSLAGDLWNIKCDPNQLESALLNLAINARDAMPDGGTLTIETANVAFTDAQAARQSGVTPGQYVCLTVRDTGVGMEAATLAKAFEPFFTTKPLGQGTGLGMSMIYGFAQQSDGHAKISSEVGHGTTFKLYLPRDRGNLDGNSEDGSETREVPGTLQGEVVLVVDDQTIIRDLIGAELSELGYRVVHAADGPEALDILRSHRRIDLLLTDIGLPGLNGRQVADAAREVRPDLKVLFMTGYAENATAPSGFLEQGMEMITKPFPMQVLAERIKTILER